MTTRKNSIYLVSGIFFLAGLSLLWMSYSDRPQPELAPVKFDGLRAYQDVLHQTALGARLPDSEAHKQARLWIRAELEAAGWQVEEQVFEALGHQGYNIIAYRDNAPAKILFGAHYDSRIYADHDPDVDKRKQAVLGANDGASGVAVQLELARSIPLENESVWLVFFDLEDNGNLPTWDWILGSRAFVDGYALNPDAVIILDMIGDADLNIYLERNSNPELREEIWAAAKELGYENNFINTEKFSMLDDHTPFVEAGYPAVDVIDFDYPYWHTTGDTADKVSAESLGIVGETMLAWLKNRH
ncbi:MAG: M28 family peptidase [Anaerolineae bacterium]|nr:M28 family peptidase [Anaerolineae bacterium]MBT7192263.1 M28 family peptidase [Anaerolineae bacterium]MBT7990920.1 M28 family peptidase [Anaerolineae bacterium]